MSDSKSIRIGIIGAGGIAQHQVKYLKQIPWVELAGVADIVPAKARESARAWGIPEANVFEDYRDLVERVELDAVSVCTFNQAHRGPAVDALAAGKHVLLEKPMAATLEDARAIMRAWEHSGKILMVGFQPDFSGDQMAAKQIADSGLLGSIYYAEAVAHRRWGVPGGSFVKKAAAGAGALVDIGVYALHAALRLMGNPRPVTVSAATTNCLIKGYRGATVKSWGGSWRPEDVEVEELATAYIRFESGAVMVFKTSWASNVDSMGRTFVMGTKGGLALDPLEVYVNQQVGDLNMTLTPRNVPKVDEWTGKMTAFAEAVRDNRPSPIDPREAYLTNVIMDGVMRSAALGEEVKVDSAY